MSVQSKQSFDVVAGILNSKSEKITAIFDYAEGFLGELFKNPEFSEFSLKSTDDWEAEWLSSTFEQGLQIKSKTKNKEIQSEETLNLSVNLNKRVDISYYSYSTFFSSTTPHIADQKDEIDSFTIDGMDIKAAAGKLITSISENHGRFSQCLELFRKNNPKLILPPKKSPYKAGMGVESLFI